MTFRVSALMAGVAVLALSSLAPVSAQPQAPVRPRYGAFGNIFSPNQAFGGAGNGFGQNQPFVNPLGPQIAGVGGLGGVYPGQVGFPQALSGAYGIAPQLPPTGIVGTFNNLGHWYGQRSGYYGHWYPNGIANGRGVLGYGGGGYGAYGGGGYGPTVGGMARPGGSLGGTALGVGATIGALRR